MPSITEIPVWIKSLGYSRAVGLIGTPFTSRSAKPCMVPDPSLLFPSPFITRPSICSETGNVRGSPMNRIPVPGSVRLSVPSKTWTTTTSSLVSSTCPERRAPSGVTTSTNSPKPTGWVLRIYTNGPSILLAPRYSLPLNSLRSLWAINDSVLVFIDSSNLINGALKP